MLHRYFQLAQNGTDVRTEVLAGITTFLAAMYIIVVNPAILSQADMPFPAVLTATVLLSAFCTVAMGIYAKNPILVAPGMGLNAFFAFTAVRVMHIPWQTALGAVFWAGVAFLLLSVFNVRSWIVQAIPKQVRFALSAGIGLFIALIGFENAGFIISTPGTLVGIGPLTPVTLTFLAGMILTSLLVIRRIPGALILGIVATTLFAIPVGRMWGAAPGGTPLIAWKGFLAMPDFSLLARLDLSGSLALAVWPVTFAILFTDMFDSLSTFVGVAEAANLTDENGEPRNVKQSLVVDAIATALAGVLGTSAGTAYIESAAGIEEGGRTGLTAVVAGLLFLPFMFLSPLLSIVPAIATAPALVLVGVFMMKPILRINWSSLDDAIPAFLALVLIPYTYSITQGIIWGFLSWTIIKFCIGKRQEVSPMLLVIDLFAILSLVLHH